MPAEDIDRAPLAVLAERYLDPAFPAERSEAGNDDVDEQGVRRVEQAVQAFASPPDSNVELGAQRTADRLEPAEVDRCRRAGLQLRDKRA